MFYIQDPSYEDSMFLHESLLKESDGSIQGAGAYAYATRDGITMLLSDELFKKFLTRGKFCLIIGMDEITNEYSISALKEFKRKYSGNLVVKAYIHNSRGSTFHPKFSWFQNAEGGSLVIGSGNLTQKGLRHNREAYCIVDYNEEDMQEVIDEWNRWYAHSLPFLFDIEEGVVLAKARQNTLRLKAAADAKSNADAVVDAMDMEELEKLYRLQPENRQFNKPVGNQREERNTLEEPGKEADDLSGSRKKEILDIDEDFDIDASYWNITQNSEILIAEIPKSGKRWKQANFDKDTFENFFGATCGENGVYRILLKSVDDDGNLGETEIRPSVSVTSSNYRFELNAAKGLEYPKGKTRPIAVFAKVSCRDFLYELLMPENENYDSIVTLINETEAASAQMRRLRYLAYDVYGKASHLPLWNRLKKEK